MIAMQNRILIVMGAAPSLLDDLAKVKKIKADYMAVNEACVLYLGNIQHLATYHPVALPGYIPARAVLGGNSDFIIHSHKGFIDPDLLKEVVDKIWPLPKVNPGYTDFRSGSSTLFGVEVGLNLGYEKIIVCGAPMEGDYEQFQEAWKRSLPYLKGKVTSMSGWTKDLLTEQENKKQEVL
jgi:hypothetical protein